MAQRKWKFTASGIMGFMGVLIGVMSILIGYGTYRLDRNAAALTRAQEQIAQLREDHMRRDRYVGQFSDSSLTMVSTNERHIIDVVDISTPYEITRHFMKLKYGPDSLISRSLLGTDFVESVERNSFTFRYRDLIGFLRTLIPNDNTIDGIPSKVPLIVRTVYYDNNIQMSDCGRYSIGYQNLVTASQRVALVRPKLTYEGSCDQNTDIQFLGTVWAEERTSRGYVETLYGMKTQVRETTPSR